jgi:hypothetical protein
MRKENETEVTAKDDSSTKRAMKIRLKTGVRAGDIMVPVHL